MKTTAVYMLLLTCIFLKNTDSHAQENIQDPVSIMQNAHWLLGEWQHETARGLSVEIWTRIADTVFSARSFRVTGADTVLLETVVLKKEGTDIYYIPTVNGQNDDLPVRFRLTLASANELLFENPSHDFPQKIRYRLEAKDTIMAEISGLLNGQERTRRFPMVRKPE